MREQTWIRVVVLVSDPHLEWPQDGTGGVHEEEAKVTEHVGQGKQALCHQDWVEGVPVLPLLCLVLKLTQSDRDRQRRLG